MYQSASAQQTNGVKLTTFLILLFQTEERVLRVSKSEITGENASKGDPFEIEDKHD